MHFSKVTVEYMKNSRGSFSDPRNWQPRAAHQHKRCLIWSICDEESAEQVRDALAIKPVLSIARLQQVRKNSRKECSQTIRVILVGTRDHHYSLLHELFKPGINNTPVVFPESYVVYWPVSRQGVASAFRCAEKNLSGDSLRERSRWCVLYGSRLHPYIIDEALLRMPQGSPLPRLYGREYYEQYGKGNQYDALVSRCTPV